MTSSAQLEREAEATRSQVAGTLNELRERITPGHLMDQAVDYAKASGGGDFVRNLGRQMADNPLPVCLIGAGMAWLMLANGTRSGTPARQSMQDTGEAAASGASDMRARMGDAAASVQDGMSEAASTLAGTASSAYETTRRGATSAGTAVGDALSSGYESVSQTASQAGSRVAQAAQQTADAGQSFLEFCMSQPLILAGAGLAFGAAMGASFPTTETENALMGETSDALKEQAKEVAQEQYAKGKAAAQDAVQGAKEAVEEHAGATDTSAHSEASLVPHAGEQHGESEERPAEARNGFVE